MESNNLNQLSIDIPNYSGPLEVLLDLAKTQKEIIHIINYKINHFLL